MAQERRIQGEFESHLAVLLKKIGQELEAVKAEQEALRQRQKRLEAEWESFAAELNEYWKLCREQSKVLEKLMEQLKDFTHSITHSSGQQIRSLKVLAERLQNYFNPDEE